MLDEAIIKMIVTTWRICKWFFLQIFLMYLMPYLWNNHYNRETICLILLYTVSYAIYWEALPKDKRWHWLPLPYFVYIVIMILLYGLIKTWDVSVFHSLLLPIYGAVCVFFVKFCRKQFGKIHKKYRFGKIITYTTVFLFFVALKLNKMPASIGTQFQGEWALYSCSMLSASLVNISQLYPETKEENIQYIDSLINIVMSSELRYYDTMRWDEDPLESLDGDESHVSYLSHLAWMICGYKQIGGDSRYDKLLSSLCGTMNRRLLNCSALNLPTYPGESIYIPDMLVAIVALNQYADMNNGKYRSTVKKWIKRAQKETFAKRQYETLKSLFWKDGAISGLKEYYDRTCYLGLDIDAGPILFELSPSGTAFMTGSATYFNDNGTRNDILTTAEIAGHTVRLNNKRHYLLANVALVGEAIMLAMRTHFK